MGSPMVKQPLVSIIIANEGQAKHLPLLFQSLQNQNRWLEDSEIFFVDQGGEDNSLLYVRAVAPSLPCQHWDVIQIESEQGGAGAAFNVGLSQATGKYALCLKPTVRLAKNFLQQCVRTLEDNPGLDFVYSSFVQQTGQVDHINRLPRFSPEGLRQANIIGPAVLMRTELFGADLHYCEVCQYEEWDFWVRAAVLVSSFARIATPLAFVDSVEPMEMNPKADGAAKARIVCNTPGFFEPAVLRWALSLLRRESWARPYLPGIIPNAQDVGRLWSRYAGTSGVALQEASAPLRTTLGGF
jgi:hypothetical protein